MKNRTSVFRVTSTTGGALRMPGVLRRLSLAFVAVNRGSMATDLPAFYVSIFVSYFLLCNFSQT